MSQSYSAQTVFTSEVEAEVLVRSSRCQYKVWIETGADQLSLIGPGVDEAGTLDELPDLPHEDLAIHCVVLFENGLWPDE